MSYIEREPNYKAKNKVKMIVEASIIVASATLFSLVYATFLKRMVVTTKDEMSHEKEYKYYHQDPETKNNVVPGGNYHIYT